MFVEENLAVIIFLAFVGFVLGLSFYLGKKAKTAGGYFAAGGQIHWAVNGIAFAGDYLSAASFLGICGMIATKGFDGFLYSIGYLSGWIVALFVVAEPMKRLGKYTFTDALDSKFNSKGIQLAAAISTLVVSIFYLIPQMVGAGVLVEPLLGLAHWQGVVMVGVIVIFIVATAGMASTTYVQFLKGALLIVFSTILTYAMCTRGLTTTPDPDQNGPKAYHDYGKMTATLDGTALVPDEAGYTLLTSIVAKDKADKTIGTFVKLQKDDVSTWWKQLAGKDGKTTLLETASQTKKNNGTRLLNGILAKDDKERLQAGNLTKVKGDAHPKPKPLSPFEFLGLLADKETEVRLFGAGISLQDGDDAVTVHVPHNLKGDEISVPGQKFKTNGFWGKLNFASLMLALFCGTAALPHILIRYYTVPSPAAARKSTIVAIAAIGFFYVLTLFMGMGAMASGVVDPGAGNMSAPLLAKAFGTFLFAVISAIAFATVLGTVSGLIVAASGAVAHDIMDRFAGMQLDDTSKVFAGKVSAAVVGLIAIVLGIIFKGMNVSFLVGWAFAVAASANLPSIIMLLFWKKTTAQGIVASIFVGTVSALGIILLSPTMYVKYLNTTMELAKTEALMPLSNPGIISIPLSFVTLVFVSLMTQKKREATA